MKENEKDTLPIFGLTTMSLKRKENAVLLLAHTAVIPVNKAKS